MLFHVMSCHVVMCLAKLYYFIYGCSLILISRLLICIIIAMDFDLYISTRRQPKVVVIDTLREPVAKVVGIWASLTDFLLAKENKQNHLHSGYLT